MNFCVQPRIGTPFHLHDEDVTDCVEILSPLCICTSSLDKKIIMYDLNTREIIKVLEGHRNGVRILASIPSYGGFLVSCAFDVMPFVW